MPSRSLFAVNLFQNKGIR